MIIWRVLGYRILWGLDLYVFCSGFFVFNGGFMYLFEKEKLGMLIFFYYLYLDFYMRVLYEYCFVFFMGLEDMICIFLVGFC